MFLLSSHSHSRAAQTVTLAWDASSSSNVAGYKVYFGTVPGNPNDSVDVGNKTTATISGLDEATTYFFFVTAYNNGGHESKRSNEVSYTTPGSLPNGFTLTVNNGSGDGSYTPGTQVAVTANPPPNGEQFSIWQGDYVILANPLSPTTSATIPFRDVEIIATYSASPFSDRIRYYPRGWGYNSRMIGGVFEGTNGDPATGPYTTIHTILTSPPLDWTTVNVSLGSYRYLRYRGPNGSHGNVAEIEFYREGSKLSGAGFGTMGSWNNGGNTFENALDGDTETYFDGQIEDGNYVGIDTGSVQGAQGTGLRAEYYNDNPSAPYPLTNPFAGSPVLTRTDATVDFDWGEDSPASQVNSNSFSVKWIGRVKAPVAGSYTFTVTGDDGVRLLINGVLVINAWRDQGATNYSYTTTLSAGTLYDIELHYYEHQTYAECRLQWSYPGQSTQVIPGSQLYPSN